MRREPQDASFTLHTQIKPFCPFFRFTAASHQCEFKAQVHRTSQEVSLLDFNNGKTLCFSPSYSLKPPTVQICKWISSLSFWKQDQKKIFDVQYVHIQGVCGQMTDWCIDRTSVSCVFVVVSFPSSLAPPLHVTAVLFFWFISVTPTDY